MHLARDYFEFQRLTGNRGLIFSFVGFLSEGILYSLGEALKQKMTLEDTDANVTKRVFSVFVEQVQNILRYSSERLIDPPSQATALSSGMVSVGREADGFFVVCGNVVREQEAIALDQRLSAMAKMDKTELKALYKEKLREPAESDSIGGNVGLIEIARRSSRPIEFDFVPVGQQQTFFCLKAYI
ncbi:MULTISPECIES: SiaB family protein kinase [Thiorhodovibrio]|uniref:Uncharacterized protein n=1 Tax=Thiorhodovibrio frisius TaxID=631362 RepID=H8YYQ3_9GAMM|nr:MULTISPECIES: SiaB family protein kinase [Thiorhodovibrio]EIC23579.1 hypothetical protein Thi970DRAFT_01251 [Thiorhodovibrio frisius]MBK5968856.1 hypothetical protein [Thiorhodovibrio winogradskyi]WPL12626.1 hypothetical protein Thiosp_02400 [Thiorhodovibrio litoralis]WPL23334.1 hypothetical protein Thiofri_03519 [Thiorhodovibrio frisius]